jgi:hypothetical protein
MLQLKAVKQIIVKCIIYISRSLSLSNFNHSTSKYSDSDVIFYGKGKTSGNLELSNNALEAYTVQSRVVNTVKT